MDWITTVNGLIALLSGLVGLIVTGVGAFFTIKAWIKTVKEKTATDHWNMIMAVADAAMKEAERSTLDGAGKKEMVVNIVKESCKSAGIDVSDFIDQLGAYIDQTIAFVNDMKAKNTTKKK